jgi:two-component system cell cycle response regulator
MRILIVEDADSIRHMIEALLTARGHAVVAVSNGVRGVEAALAAPPDVILLDLHLPGALDGFAVCRKLREEPATRDVPIVVISAMTDAGSKQRALEAGTTAYYTKPFSPTALLKEIESIPERVLKPTKPPGT